MQRDFCVDAENDLCCQLKFHQLNFHSIFALAREQCRKKLIEPALTPKEVEGTRKDPQKFPSKPGKMVEFCLGENVTTLNMGQTWNDPSVEHNRNLRSADDLFLQDRAKKHLPQSRNVMHSSLTLCSPHLALFASFCGFLPWTLEDCIVIKTNSVLEEMR